VAFFLEDFFTNKKMNDGSLERQNGFGFGLMATKNTKKINLTEKFMCFEVNIFWC
jgi:hypothetical protein